MKYVVGSRPKKYIVGISMKTSNAECHKDIPPLWERFRKEEIMQKIPYRVNDAIWVVYTDYEKDYTKPYLYILGCEVSLLEKIPKGLVSREIPAAKYAIFTPQGKFPDNVIHTWQAIWDSPLKRAYTSDFEVYGPDFHPQNNPDIQIYVAVNE